MTPTSATGARGRPREAGFTLVEVMVVVTIVGLLTGMAVLSIPGAGPGVSLEAERFGARLQRAQEEAVLTNRPVEVAFNAVGYGFRVREAGGWRPLVEAPFRDVAWEPDTRIADEQDVGAVAFDPTGAATPAAVRLTRGERSVRVLVDPAGNVRIDAARGG